MSLILRMRRFFFLLLTISFTGILFGEGEGSPRVTQFATIDRLLAGSYDGWISLKTVKNHGNFGLGTFDRIDGELTLVDGIVYQTRGDGSIAIPEETGTVPFASVLFFKPDRFFDLDAPLDWNELTALIDKALPNRNVFAAIRIDGDFTNVKARSEYAQNKPYRPLAEVMKDQSIFDLGKRSGTVIGFRTPGFFKGINVPGFHFHFIDRNRKCGGHLINFHIQKAHLSLQIIQEFLIILPEESPNAKPVDLDKDRTLELDQVERIRDRIGQ